MLVYDWRLSKKTSDHCLTSSTIVVFVFFPQTPAPELMNKLMNTMENTYGSYCKSKEMQKLIKEIAVYVTFHKVIIPTFTFYIIFGTFERLFFYFSVEL